MYNRWIIGFLILLGMVACRQKTAAPEQEYQILVKSLPSYFPELPVPEKNPLNDAKIELGKRLFYDPALSKDSSVSCASCHYPQFAYTDERKGGIGESGNPTLRNSPTLANMAFHPYYMFDGGIPTLELQVVAPLMHPDEMGFDLFEAVERLKNNREYVRLAEEAFGEPLNAGSTAYAIAAFERTILSFSSPYDRYLQGEKTALNEEQKRGMELFMSDSLNCSACHSGYNLSDYGFYNIGLYRHYADPGRWRVTENPADSGKFKVPTLRNIELTGPYMHDGSLATLAEVIAFKMTGGADHPLKSEKVHAFTLNDEDQQALIAFLQSFTDWEFINREIERKKK